MIGMGHRWIRHLATRKESRAMRGKTWKGAGGGRGGDNPILKISMCEKQEEERETGRDGKEEKKRLRHLLH